MRLPVAAIGGVAFGVAISTSVAALPVNGDLRGVAARIGAGIEPAVVCRSVKQRVCRPTPRGRVCSVRVVRRCV